MNTTPLTNIAPEIFRKRLLIEGFFDIQITAEVLKQYFTHITSELGLRTYDEPIIHATSGQGKTVNEGFDGFVPLSRFRYLHRHLGKSKISLDDYLHVW